MSETKKCMRDGCNSAAGVGPLDSSACDECWIEYPGGWDTSEEWARANPKKPAERVGDKTMKDIVKAGAGLAEAVDAYRLEVGKLMLIIDDERAAHEATKRELAEWKSPERIAAIDATADENTKLRAEVAQKEAQRKSLMDERDILAMQKGGCDAEIAGLRTEVERLTRSRDNWKDQHDSINRQATDKIRSLEAEVERLKGELATLAGECERLRLQCNQTSADRDELRRSFDMQVGLLTSERDMHMERARQNAKQQPAQPEPPNCDVCNGVTDVLKHVKPEPTNPGTAFLPGLGTIRECRHCACLVAGGPNACLRCANGSDFKVSAE